MFKVAAAKKCTAGFIDAHAINLKQNFRTTELIVTQMCSNNKKMPLVHHTSDENTIEKVGTNFLFY